LKTRSMRFYKVSLDEECNFWDEKSLCHETCSVKNDEKFGDVSWRADQADLRFLSRRDEEDIKDFCAKDEKHGQYVDLLENEEGWTGYDGESAHRIWKSIYDEACSFRRPTKTSGVGKEACLCGESLEQRLWYRLISGMHASVSSHISMNWYDSETRKWGPNKREFMRRLGNHPERLKNLHFAYMVVLRAITKLESYLLSYNYENGDKTEELKSRFREIIFIADWCPTKFEDVMFNRPDSVGMKEDLRKRFYSVSKIMNCVDCQKCKLWGKLQMRGFGVALKVLFSFPENCSDFKLERSEIVALMNLLGRLSDSVSNVLTMS